MTGSDRNDDVRTAPCSVCDRKFRLRKNGTLWTHSDHRQATSLPFKPRCGGSGLPPAGDLMAALEQSLHRKIRKLAEDAEARHG